MRVIAGRHRGTKLKAVRGEIRPTSDRLRESLFNILGELIEGSVWLDGFAGSGAVGIEALSRGARLVIFNDRDPSSIHLLRANLKKCSITSGFEISADDIFTRLRNLRTPKLDFVYLDPPYRFGRYEKLLNRLLVCEAFDREETLILLEIFKKTSLDFIPAAIRHVRTVKSGDSHLLLLKGIAEDLPSQREDIQSINLDS